MTIIKKAIAELDGQIAAMQAARTTLAALLPGNHATGRRMTAAGRAAISRAQRKRWAAVRKKK